MAYLKMIFKPLCQNKKVNLYNSWPAFAGLNVQEANGSIIIRMCRGSPQDSCDINLRLPKCKSNFTRIHLLLHYQTWSDSRWQSQSMIWLKGKCWALGTACMAKCINKTLFQPLKEGPCCITFPAFKTLPLDKMMEEGQEKKNTHTQQQNLITPYLRSSLIYNEFVGTFWTYFMLNYSPP